MTSRLFSLALLSAAAFGQTKLSFEVATVKPAPPLDPAKMLSIIQSGGRVPIGAHTDAHRAEYLYMTVKSLIAHAYQVKPYQVSGPDWLDQQRFDIVAKYPDGATKDDAPRMLLSLLEERFRLQVHKSVEQRPVFGLVAGKGGPKLKRSAAKPAPIDESAPLKPGERRVDGPSGKPMLVRTELATGAVMIDMGEEGSMSYRVDRAAVPTVIHVAFSSVTMSGFAGMLTQIVSQVAGAGMRQIVDTTGIEGNYEASLDLSVDDMIAMVRNAGLDIPPPNPGAGGPSAADDTATIGLSLSGALRSMGLKLESRTAPVELLIVDHAEKKPTEN